MAYFWTVDRHPAALAASMGAMNTAKGWLFDISDLAGVPKGLTAAPRRALAILEPYEGRSQQLP
jgi:hypothetical protein